MLMIDKESGSRRPFSAGKWYANKVFAFNGLWFWGVAIVPFLLIVIFRGWDETFRTGEAYLYLMGVTVAVLGEVGIELAENGIKSLKEIKLKAKVSAFTNLALSLALAGWGAVLVVSQPRVHHPTTSWVQVVVFFLALTYLSATRFAFKGETSIYTQLYGSSSGNGGQTARTVATTVATEVDGHKAS